MNQYAFLPLAVLPAVLIAQPEQKPQQRPLAFTHATVIDATGAAAQRDMTVVITGDRITAVGKTDQIALPDGARTVDGAGKFLIPGLWDMHVHIAGESYLPLFLANGVTGVRDMGAIFPDALLALRKAVRDGKLLGPRLIAAGAMIDGDKPIRPGSLTARNAEEGRKAVQELKSRGVDFIKVQTKLSRPAYLAIADQAKEEGLPFVGHVPEAVSAVEASDVGQKSFEHLFGILLACSTEEDKLRKDELDAMAKLDKQEIRLLLVRSQVQALDSYSDAKAQALFRRLAKNRTWQVPTLTLLRALASQDDEKFTSDPRVKYMPSYIRSRWKETWPPETIAKLETNPPEIARPRDRHAPRRRAVPGRHRCDQPLLFPRLHLARRVGAARGREQVHADGSPAMRDARPGEVPGPGKRAGHGRKRQARGPDFAGCEPPGQHHEHADDHRRGRERQAADESGVAEDAGRRRGCGRQEVKRSPPNKTAPADRGRDFGFRRWTALPAAPAAERGRSRSLIRNPSAVFVAGFMTMGSDLTR